MKTGLLRCYVSRAENDHTVPASVTLEKFVRVLELAMYHLMYDGENVPAPPKATKANAINSWDSSAAVFRLMHRLVPLLTRMTQADRNMILLVAGKVSKKSKTTKLKSPVWDA